MSEPVPDDPRPEPADYAEAARLVGITGAMTTLDAIEVVAQSLADRRHVGVIAGLRAARRTIRDLDVTRLRHDVPDRAVTALGCAIHLIREVEPRTVGNGNVND